MNLRREPHESGIGSELSRPMPPARHTKGELDLQEQWAGGVERDLDLPRWVRALIEKKCSPNEILDTLVRRVRKGATSACAGLDIANEIGRLPDGGERIRKYLTEALLNELSKSEAER